MEQTTTEKITTGYFPFTDAMNNSVLPSDLMSDSIPSSNNIKTCNKKTTENLTESSVSSSDLMKNSSPSYDPMNDSFYLPIL